MNGPETTIASQPDEAFALQKQRLELEAGVLGKFFGGRAAPSSIAGLTVVLLVGAGVVLLFVESKLPVAEYWKIASPIITLALGYLFGHGGK